MGHGTIGRRYGRRGDRPDRVGRAWGHRGVRGRMEVDLDLFERPATRLREAIKARLQSIAGFLGYTGLHVRDVPTVVPNRVRVRRPLA